MTKTIPTRCPDCRNNSLKLTLVNFESSIKYDGIIHAFTVRDCPVLKCHSCSAILHTTDSHDSIDRAARNHLGLLHSSQIRSNRKLLGLKQHELAEQLRVSAESISRWETGRVMQSRSSDLLLRLYFESPIVRQYTTRFENDISIGCAVKLAKQLTWTNGAAKTSNPIRWSATIHRPNDHGFDSYTNPFKLVG